MSDSAALLRRLPRLAALGVGAPVALEADTQLIAALTRGQLHEVYASGEEDAAAAAGFTVALALAARATPLIWLRTVDAERLTGRLHATGLIELGLAPDAVVLVVVADAGSLLRAAADAARCTGIGTAVLESWGPMPTLDLTATRRLVLAAEASGVAVVSLRCRAEPVASAAAVRWSVAAAPSTALDAGAPGLPVFDIELLRRRGGPAGARRRVEWNRDKQCFDPLDAQGGTQTPLAGAGLPLVADRAAPGDSPAPLRARG